MSRLKYIRINKLRYSVISIKRIRNENSPILLGSKLLTLSLCLNRYLTNNNAGGVLKSMLTLNEAIIDVKEG